MRRLTPICGGVISVAVSLLLAGCGSTTSNPQVMPSSPKLGTTPTASASLPGHVRDCTSAQLTLKYYGGGEGAGNNFGTVAVLNRSGTACMWRGGVSVLPLDRNRQIMGDNATTAANASAMTATVDGILLSAHGYVVQTQPAPAGDRWGEIEVSGDARDDSKSPSGTCSKANQITPAYWGIATIGQKFTVVNDDEANRGANSFVGVTACRGLFNRMFVSTSG